MTPAINMNGISLKSVIAPDDPVKFHAVVLVVRMTSSTIGIMMTPTNMPITISTQLEIVAPAPSDISVQFSFFSVTLNVNVTTYQFYVTFPKSDPRSNESMSKTPPTLKSRNIPNDLYRSRSTSYLHCFCDSFVQHILSYDGFSRNVVVSIKID